jgi:hypothetical protein
MGHFKGYFEEANTLLIHYCPERSQEQFRELRIEGGAATLWWFLQQLHSKTVLAHIGVFPNKCTIKHPFHT